MVIYALYGAGVLATVIFDRIRWIGLAFLCFTIYFVAFRFETGFDWPIYKALYSIGKEAGTVDFGGYSRIYNGEPLYIITQSLLAKIFPSYEYLQFIYSAIFLSSLFYFGVNFARAKVFEFLSIVMSYLVLTVGFSTVRQSLAISFVLLALVLFNRGRFYFAAAIAVVGVFFHYSAILYVAAFLICIASIRFDRTRGVATFSVVLIAILCSYVCIFLAWKFGILPSGERVHYYAAALQNYRFGLWDGMFAALFIGMAGHVMISEAFFSRNLEHGKIHEMISRMVLVLAAISFASLILPVVRDRLSYLLWILYAVFLTRPGVFLRKLATISVVAFGILFNVIAHFRYPNSLMFLPYQNSITGSTGGAGRSGGERYNEFIIEHNKLLAQ